MKIYIVNGFGYNPSENCIETYSVVRTSRNEAESQLKMIIDEQVGIAKSETCFGIDYVETLQKTNGNIHHYNIETIYDLRKSEQKEAFLWSTLVVGGNIKNDEYHPVLDEDRDMPEIRVMTLCSIGIKEQEV